MDSMDDIRFGAEVVAVSIGATVVGCAVGFVGGLNVAVCIVVSVDCDDDCNGCDFESHFINFLFIIFFFYDHHILII